MDRRDVEPEGNWPESTEARQVWIRVAAGELEVWVPNEKRQAHSGPALLVNSSIHHDV